MANLDSFKQQGDVIWNIANLLRGPYRPDARIDHGKIKIGYEIPFNRHFYVFQPPRPLAEIDAELKTVTDKILTMIGGLTK